MKLIVLIYFVLPKLCKFGHLYKVKELIGLFDALTISPDICINILPDVTNYPSKFWLALWLSSYNICNLRLLPKKKKIKYKKCNFDFLIKILYKI